MNHDRRRIVLAVTSAVSLKLMTGFPEYLSSRGWEVHVVTSLPQSGAYPRGTGFSIHNVPMVRDPSPARDLVSLLRWVLVLRRLKPDVVVAGTPKAGLLGMIAAWMQGVRVRIYMLRGLRLETSTGWRRNVLALTERCAAAASHQVLAVSPSLRSEYVRLRLAAENKVTVLGAGSSNGVDLGRSVAADQIDGLRRSLHIEKSNLVVGFVGRIAADKGLNTLLTAVANLRRRGRKIDILVVGSEEPVGLLASMVESSGVDRAAVHWAGAVDDVTPYYALMQVLCLPTMREGFPNVVLEAAVQCVPAIVTTATGAVDSVVDGVTGYHFPVGDSEALAQRLDQFHERSPLAAKMGICARSHAEENYARDQVWKAQERMLEELLAANLQRRPPQASDVNR